MHVEPPAHAPQTLKDFAKHYLMIVLGILTAVGIEQAIEARHHHELATQATAHIDEELRSNLREARSALADNEKRMAALRAAQDAVLDDARKGNMSAETFRARIESISVGVAMPTLRRDAWDAAIASQALTYVDAARVRQFSEGYSAQRNAMEATMASLPLGNWLGLLQGATVDAKLGRVDHATLLKAFTTYGLVLTSTLGNERELEQAAPPWAPSPKAVASAAEVPGVRPARLNAPARRP
jgi:hypothetical protein